MTRYSTLMAGVASPDPQVAAEYAREALRYEPDTGEFYWKERPPHHFGTKRGQNVFNAQFAGTRAGAVIRGYRRVQICGRLYACHRLAWLMVHDSWHRIKSIT